MISMKKGTAFFAALLLLLLPAAGCKPAAEVRTVFAMDTGMTFTLYGKNAKSAADRVEQEILRLDALLNPGGGEESDVARVNAGAGEYSEVSSETAGLFMDAKEISAETGGAFDITVRPLTDAWGFFTKAYRVPGGAELESLLGAVGYNRIETDGARVKIGAGQAVDFGGIAKGYLTDRVGEILRANGIESAVLDLGGNVLVAGGRAGGDSWRIGLRDPNNLSQSFGVLELRDTAVVTSGSYERFFEENGKTYHHILDPKTGRPAESGLISVSIVTKNGTRADGLSTALFVMGLEGASAFWREHRDFGMVLVTDGGEVYVTGDLIGSYTPGDVSYPLHTIE